MKKILKFSISFVAAFGATWAIFCQEPRVTIQELKTFQDRIKKMMAAEKLDEGLIDRKIDFWFGDCDSGAFSKGTYNDALRTLKIKRRLNWSRVSNSIPSNYFEVDLEKPKGKNPKYQGSRFYFEKTRNGKIFWTGYCDRIQYE